MHTFCLNKKGSYFLRRKIKKKVKEKPIEPSFYAVFDLIMTLWSRRNVVDFKSSF